VGRASSVARIVLPFELWRRRLRGRLVKAYEEEYQGSEFSLEDDHSRGSFVIRGLPYVALGFDSTGNHHSFFQIRLSEYWSLVLSLGLFGDEWNFQCCKSNRRFGWFGDRSHYDTGHAVFSTYLQYEHIVGAGELTVVMASMIGVGLGFLWYNAHPASVFMGDVGSLGLGGLLGGVALMTKKELVLMLAGFLFVIEAVSVMLQVGSFKLRGKRIFKMAPLHHHFELSGWPESKVIVRFWILSILFALLALSTLKIR